MTLPSSEARTGAKLNSRKRTLDEQRKQRMAEWKANPQQVKCPLAYIYDLDDGQKTV